MPSRGGDAHGHQPRKVQIGVGIVTYGAYEVRWYSEASATNDQEAILRAGTGFTPRPDLAAVLLDRVDEIMTRLATGERILTLEVGEGEVELDATYYEDAMELSWTAASSTCTIRAFPPKTAAPRIEDFLAAIADVVKLHPQPVKPLSWGQVEIEVNPPWWFDSAGFECSPPE